MAPASYRTGHPYHNYRESKIVLKTPLDGTARIQGRFKGQEMLGLEIFEQIVNALLMVDIGVFKCISVGVFNGHIHFAILGKGEEVDVKGQFVAVEERLRSPIFRGLYMGIAHLFHIGLKEVLHIVG